MCVPGCKEAVHATLSRRGFFRGAAAAGFAVTALSSAEAQSKTKGKEKKEPASAAGERYFKAVVDLTHTMSPEFPTFFGVPGIEIEKKFDFKKDGFNLNWWRIIEHAGTHLDAPIHFSENGATVEKIVAGELVVPLAVIDVRQQGREGRRLSGDGRGRADLGEALRQLPDNCCVAMLSGWAQHVGNPAKYTRQGCSRRIPFPRFRARSLPNGC